MAFPPLHRRAPRQRVEPPRRRRWRPPPPHQARELYRRVNADGAPDSWGLRLLNGHDEQQLTVLLPNPFLSDHHEYLLAPDWSRLALWDHLRKEYLGLPPDAFDRTGHALHPRVSMRGWA